ncbi:MAG: glycosyltransferase family 39 protein [candidate division Zixibacteria bacterium]|nr:glycosyltransferase family 39 protein [candidate division Zixibacteria bacterium]
MNLFKNNFIFSLLYATLAFVVIYVITSGGLGISVDSENYLTIANGFTQQRWGESFNPVWPPFYPLTIAAIKALRLAELVDAARIVSILSFVILVVTIFLLGLQLQGKFTAHFSAISTMFLAPLIYLYSFCWSETMYIMFSLLFFFMLILLLKAPEERRTKYLIWSGIFAGLATITRYVGFSLIGTGILSILFLSNYLPWSKKFKKTLTFMLVASIPVFLHYLTCFYYYGLAGKTQFPPKYSFVHQLSRFFSTIYHDFLSFDLSFWNYVFFFEWRFPFFWLRIIVLLCTLILLVLFFKSVFSSKLSKALLKPPIGMIFYFVLYSSIILYIGSTIAIDPTGSRFTVPLYPFILLLVFFSVSHVCKIFAQRRTKRLVFSLAILGIVIFGGIQIISTLSIYKGISSGSFPAMEHPGNLNRESIKFLKENVDSNDFIITNIHRKLAFIWPRQEPYLDIPKKDWEKAVNEIMYEASQRSIYVLLCTEDFSPYGITVEDIEKTDEKIGLFSWKKIFGNDYIYKTKYVVFRQPQKSKKKE